MALKKLYSGIDEIFQTVLADGGQYETSGKFSSEASDNRLQALNSFYGIGNARNYSSVLQWQSWRIDEIAKLQQTRFNMGEEDIIGRDIFTRYSKLVESDIIRDMVYRADYAPVEFSFIDSNGDNRTVKVWLPGSGKRTRYGKESDGEIVERLKIHYTSKHKRNRRTMGF